MMLGAFAAFRDELKQTYPGLFAHGEFDDVLARFERLSVATNEEAIGLSDQCVAIVRRSARVSDRLYFVEEAIRQFARDMRWLDA
jgi:hypothetical protein